MVSNCFSSDGPLFTPLRTFPGNDVVVLTSTHVPLLIGIYQVREMYVSEDKMYLLPSILNISSSDGGID